MSTLFEILVPAILILVGFSFTKVHFPIISPPRTLRPELYPWKQRIMVGSKALLKYGRLDYPDEEFHDIFEDQLARRHQDLDPSILIENLPGYE